MFSALLRPMNPQYILAFDDIRLKSSRSLSKNLKNATYEHNPSLLKPSTLHHTTAYHPQASGFVENFTGI